MTLDGYLLFVMGSLLLVVILGLSAMLAASPRAFAAVRWIGAAYLVCLGVQAQLLLLGVTVNVIALAFNVPLVFVATRVSTRLRESGSGAASLRLTRAMGVVFILLGLRVAVS